MSWRSDARDAFTHAVQQELAAMRMHEQTAALQDVWAAHLAELPATGGSTDWARQAATVRERAAGARARASAARQRLSADGIDPDTGAPFATGAPAADD